MSDILGILNNRDVEGLTALIEKLEQSSFDYMKLEGDGLNITIGKNGYTDDAPVAVCAAPAAPVAAAAPAAVEAPAAPAPAEKAASVPSGADVCYIKSPSYGLFYAQPEPGAPTYVKVGDHVAVGDTVGLLEIMKTYTAITADIAGTIVEILVNNQDAVEPDQALFAIQAD